MKYIRQIIIHTILLFVPFSAILAQQQVSYRIVLDDHELPKEVRASFKAMGISGYIYRLQVTNRKNTYIIRLNEFGEVVQVKYN